MDAFRALAATLVLLGHLRNLMFVDFSDVAAPTISVKLYYLFTGFGHQSVIVFFVLSGFWISKSVVGRANRAHFWRDYGVARLSRLMIVLIPALMIGGLVDAIGINALHAPLYSGATGANSVPPTTLTTRTPLIFLANATFLQTLVAPVFGSNGPLWSLAFEFWYYWWFPALFLLLARRRLSLALLALPMALLSAELTAGFACWLCGAGLMWGVEASRGWSIAKRRGSGIAALIVGGFALAAVLVASRAGGGWPMVQDVLLAISFALALFGVIQLDPRRIRAMRPVAAFGARSSYSLYVIHYPLIALAVAALLSARVQPSPVRLLEMAGLVIGAMSVAIAFSWATEARTSMLRRAILGRLAPRRQQVHSGG